MNVVQIQVRGHDSQDDIMSILSSKQSGFRITQDRRKPHEFRRPLSSVVGDVATIVGVVLSAAQLAASLYEISRLKSESESSNAEKQPVEVYILTPKGPVMLSGKSEEEIKDILEAYQTRDE